MDYGGSSNIKLFGKKQVKAPDLSFLQTWKRQGTDPEEDAERNRTPTVVVEIGVSQSVRKLNYDAARLLMGTHGLIQLVLNVKIERNPEDLYQVDWITADMWTLEDTSIRGWSPIHFHRFSYANF